MPERILRRERSDFWSDTAHILFVGALVLALIFGAYKGVKSGFRWIWIDLHSVTVPDHQVGEDPGLKISRVLRRDFRGRWQVQIYRAGTHKFVCAASGPWINYLQSADTGVPMDMDLSKWLLNRAALADCEAEGFGVGDFYLITCHRVRPMGILFERCVPSNTFRRSAPLPPEALAPRARSLPT